MTGRKKLEAQQQASVVIDQKGFGEAMQSMREEGQAVVEANMQHAVAVRAVAAQIGYQLPADCVDADLIQRDIAANMRRTAEAMLQIGLGLIVLKEACRHGEFKARLEVLGFESRVAQKYMQVAKRFSNAPSTAHLLKAVESQTKLLELIVLDDEQLEELELTGQTGELKLDDVATMSVKELRKAVRELKADVAAKEEVLARRSEQINALEENLSRAKKLPPDEVLAELHREATAMLNDTRGALIGKFSACVAAIDAHHDANGGESAVFLAGLVGQLQEDIAALREAYGIPDVTPAMIPEWVNDQAFAALAKD